MPAPRPSRLAVALVVVVAVLHVWFFVLESLLWRTPIAEQAFGVTRAELDATAVLAMNQGVYNLVLAIGLGWALRSDEAIARATFFLAAIVFVGLFGALTAFPSIFFLQALPAAVALVVVRRDAN